MDRNAPGRYNEEYLLKGKIYDQLGDMANAQRAFANYIAVEPNEMDAVPEHYRMAIAEEKSRVEQKYNNLGVSPYPLGIYLPTGIRKGQLPSKLSFYLSCLYSFSLYQNGRRKRSAQVSPGSGPGSRRPFCTRSV